MLGRTLLLGLVAWLVAAGCGGASGDPGGKVDASGGDSGGGDQTQCAVRWDTPGGGMQVPILGDNAACDECSRKKCAGQCQAFLADYAAVLAFVQCETSCANDFVACKAAGGDVGDCNVKEATCIRASSGGCETSHLKGGQACAQLVGCESQVCKAECGLP